MNLVKFREVSRGLVPNVERISFHMGYTAVTEGMLP